MRDGSRTSIRQRRNAGQLRSTAATIHATRHLRVLRTRGLIEEERVEDDGRVRVYRLCSEPFRDLQEWLEEVESFWSDQLDAFKAHAERRERGHSV